MANGAVNYKFMDEKLGLGPGGGSGLAEKAWAVGITPAVGDIYVNGGFKFRCSVSGATAASGVGPTPQYLVDNACTWVLVGPAAAITGVDATQAQEVGYIALGKDVGPNAYGVGEFQYVKFNGTVTAGDFVVIDRGAGNTIQASTGNGKGSIGIAMCSAVAGQYGWAMVRGIHDGANVASGVAAGTPLYLTATAGRPNGTVVAGNKADGAYERLVAASANNVGTVELEWPAWSGNG
jgi:hypothetical protein